MNFLKTIKDKIQKCVVPERGIFSPITAIKELEDKSRLTFTIQPLDGSETGKKAAFAFINFSNGKIAVKSKKFSSKAEFDAYLDSLKEEDISNMLSEFKKNTK